MIEFTDEQLELIQDCLVVASEQPPQNSGELMRIHQRAKDKAYDLYEIVRDFRRAGA